MVFLTATDFNMKVSSDILNQITQTDNTILDDAEKQAIGIINDNLSSNFDIDTEIAKTDNERHDNLLRWMLNLTLYFIYERVPDDQVPERVVKNFDDTITEIEMIARGKKNTTLARVIDEETSEIRTTFRYGSNAKRDHNPY